VKVLYTAIATAEGGRDGMARSLDGNLDVRIVPPKELGGSGAGTNPEQLFAAGYAACFQSAMQLVAKARGLDVTDSSVTAEVDLGAKPDGTFGLAVRLLASVPDLDDATTHDLLVATHKVCPYSNATRGNIEVELIAE
jgi:Ohr subfamily peroxiredoxin